MIKNRYLARAVLDDLREKMVFVGGPRQVGKTTFAVEIIGAGFNAPAYFNWDHRSDRKSLRAESWPAAADLIILDEIHKWKIWKSWIKGEYDAYRNRLKFLVTGSARMDLYRRGGESLQGRYHYYRLHPFSLAEILNKAQEIQPFREIRCASRDHRDEFQSLFEYGGFPEPLLKASPRFLRRWHNEKVERLFRDDISEVERIRDLGRMKLLSDMLPERVGSLLSANALREDLEVSHRAVSSWLDILESFYYHFRLYPYSGKLARSLKKEPKLYLWDWSEVADEAARFENLLASHLLKLCHYLYDVHGFKAQLHFLRMADKREVDFIVTIDGKPWMAIEAKLSDEDVSKPLFYYRDALKIPFSYQVVKKFGVHKLTRGVHVVSADRFLAGLV